MIRYTVATRDKLQKLDIEVEIYYSLINNNWVLDKNYATSFTNRDEALGLKKLLNRDGLHIVSVDDYGVNNDPDLLENEIPYFPPGMKGIDEKFMRE